ncbi:MAG TPA: gamma-glutamylcyclotransferase family protein [Nocardioidaceae bacterium]|nr:gamma-glutamylcyclotransferase family protein [Nocardioidaceae bacterium]
MTQRLFVYGTLAPGQPNAHELADIQGEWEPATVRGQLFPEGWGAAIGYPAIVLDDHGPEVEGFLFTTDGLSQHWDRLDEFEGEGYDRVLTAVRLEGGTSVVAYVYVLRLP